uniref:interferon-induced, double-stranded RNA-activated protein kinase-like n=1 Tax=Fragaria vesca subsp. vesca TaxID=101020 RepID=UPI0005C81C7A|nr:PREDICTED: interferon-induced, double-stranded RNA-activated protein kinase-like [Fragaria vesca subsp. vesca]
MSQVDPEGAPDGFDVIREIFCPLTGRKIFSSLVSSIDKTPCWYLSNYKELELLGTGTYGVVAKCKNKLDGKCCAIKKVDLGSTHDCYESAISEASIWSKLDHPNIVKYYGCWIENQIWGEKAEEDGLTYEKKRPCLYLKLEACDSSLVDTWRTLTARQTSNIIEGVVEGLEHIHSFGFSHGDLSKDNILISKGISKICDFGRASEGTPQDQKEDIYKLGLMIVELVDPSAVSKCKTRNVPEKLQELD